MLLIQDNFLTDIDISFLLSKWGDYETKFSKQAINFYYIDFKKYNIDLTSIKNGLINSRSFQKIRLQKYDDSYEQIKEFHKHTNFHNYIVFLNDDFKGGELEFENGVTIIPKKGSLVYFNENIPHRVHDCIGDRFVFILSGDEPLDLNIDIKVKHII